jgi:hypothetical protein
VKGSAPRRDADLPVDEVDPGDELGDGMLHLQAGVHFKKIKFVRKIGVEDEFDGSGVEVVDGAPLYRGFPICWRISGVSNGEGVSSMIF